MESVETDLGPSPGFSCLCGSEDSLPGFSIETAVAERTTPFPSPVKLTPVEDVALTVVPKPTPRTALEADVVLSPTQARTFLGCAARWWFKYGLSLPEPKTSYPTLSSQFLGVCVVNPYRNRRNFNATLVAVQNRLSSHALHAAQQRAAAAAPPARHTPCIN
jgi:hypothetical protein